MTRPIDDLGHCLVVARPLRLRTYLPAKRPDPTQNVGCLILVNNPADGPRLRLEVSNGAEWDALALVAETRPPAPVDLMPDIRHAVEQALPLLVARPQPAALPPPVQHALPAPDGLQEANRAMASAVLEMSEHVNRLLGELADLQARVEFLEKHAIAKVKVG